MSMSVEESEQCQQTSAELVFQYEAHIVASAEHRSCVETHVLTMQRPIVRLESRRMDIAVRAATLHAWERHSGLSAATSPDSKGSGQCSGASTFLEAVFVVFASQTCCTATEGAASRILYVRAALIELD